MVNKGNGGKSRQDNNGVEKFEDLYQALVDIESESRSDDGIGDIDMAV